MVLLIIKVTTKSQKILIKHSDWDLGPINFILWGVFIINSSMLVVMVVFELNGTLGPLCNLSYILTTFRQGQLNDRTP